MGTGPHLKLLSPSILDKLVHPLAQVPDERVGPQRAPGLLPLLQPLLQQGKPVQQLVQDQGQRRAGALWEEAAGRGTGSHWAGVQAQGAGQVGCSYLGQEHHVDARPQGQAVHGVGHHGAVDLFHTGIQENPSGAGRCWGARDQRLECVFSYLWRKRGCGGRGQGARLASSSPWIHPVAHSSSSL